MLSRRQLSTIDTIAAASHASARELQEMAPLTKTEKRSFKEGQSRLQRAFAGRLRRLVHEDLNRQGMMDRVGGMMRIMLRRLLGPLLIFGPG
jgi:hypothetical protein